MAANNRRKVRGLKPIVVVPQYFFPVLKTTHLLLLLSEIDHSDSFLGNREQNLGTQGLHQELIKVYHDPVYQRLLIDRVQCKKCSFLALNLVTGRW